MRDGVFAIDALSGKVIWHRETKGPVTGSPAVHCGRVYVGVAGEKRQGLIVLRSKTGQEEWRVPGLSIFAGPTISGDFLFVGTAAGQLFAYSIHADQLKWEKRFQSGSLRPVAAEDGKLYWEAGGKLVVLNASSGEILWKSAAAPEIATTVHAGMVFSTLHNRREIRALLCENGREAWRFSEESRISYTSASKGILYARSSRKLYALRACSGHLVWSYDIKDGAYGEWVVVPAGRVVLILEDKGCRLTALESSSGKPAWQWKSRSRLHLPAVTKAAVYLSDDEGILYALTFS